MRILALDLSMIGTGYASIDTDLPFEAWEHGTIRTSVPGRKAGMSDTTWDVVRFHRFASAVGELVDGFGPEAIAVEVTNHAHGTQRGKRTSRGHEFKSGLYLGQAKGWLHGALSVAAEWGTSLPPVELITSAEAKLRTTGNQAADKEAVRGFLEDDYGWDLKEWKPDEVDALAVGMTYLKLHHPSALPSRSTPNSDDLETTAATPTGSPTVRGSTKTPTIGAGSRRTSTGSGSRRRATTAT